MDRPRALDLFSGIGGFSLGLEAAGYETAAFCEISPTCRHLLRHHWPDVPIFDDVTTLTGEQVGPVDAICGGFPCQDISFAGKGAGIGGERSGLWRHYARLIGELRPRNVFVENVAALLGRGLGDVLGDLASLGYHAWWDCIPAAAVGAPHRRDRLWIVAYPGSLEHEGYGDALRREIAAELSRADPMADAESQCGCGCGCGAEPSGRCQSSNGGEALADADSTRLPLAGLAGRQGQAGCAVKPRGAANRSDWWAAEPDVGRVAHGVPARVDRLHGLGNAVVPQIPEILARAVLSVEARQRAAA